MTCNNLADIAATHTKKDLKTEVTLQWKAPIFTSGSSKTVVFTFSVVESYTTYWTNKEATNTLVVEADTTANPEPEPEVEPEVEPETTAEPVDTSTFHADYQGCNVDKGCFGSGNCVDTGTCQIMATYQYVVADKAFRMTIHGKDAASNDYVALGLSDDAKMGSDLVFYCLAGTADPVKVSWNDGQTNVQGVTEAQVTSGDIKTENGVNL
jgi:hypothetical protein